MATRRKKPKVTEKILPITESKYKLNFKHFDLTDKQKDFLHKAFDKKTKIMFIAGPAGCSKTFMSVYSALRLFQENNDLDIFYVRTIVESADRGLGHLPGDVEEKFHPFMMPLTDKMQEILANDQIKMLTEEKIISAAHLNKPKFCQGCGEKFKGMATDASVEGTEETSEQAVTLGKLDYSIDMENSKTTLGDLLNNPLNPTDMTPRDSAAPSKPLSKEEFLAQSMAECASRQQSQVPEDGG
jgi:hypothetical protein